MSDEGIVGMLLEDIDSHPHAYPDTRNTIKLRTNDTRDILMSYDRREMLNRKGLLIVGEELMNYGNAEDDENQNWELSYLFRGRKGAAARSHVAGERVVLFDYGSVPFIDASLYDVGKTFTLRVTSLGTDENYTMSFTFNGNSQRERKPTLLKVRKSKDGNMLIKWQGVGRLGGGSQVAMGAYFDGYIVTVNGKKYDIIGNRMSLEIPYESGVVSVAQANKIMGAGESISVRVE